MDPKLAEDAWAGVYEEVVDVLGEGVTVQVSDGRIVYANPAAERILGLTADQLAGRTSTDPCWRSIHADGRDFPGDEHPAMVSLRTGTAVRDVVMGVHKPDGSLTWILITAQPLAEQEGSPHSVVSMFTDITRLRAAESAVASRERRLRGVIDALPDPIVMLAPVRDEGGAVVDLAISEANGAAAGFAGAPRAELVGRRASDLLATDPPSRILDVALPVLETGRPAYLDDIASDRLGILGGRWYDVRIVRVEDGLAVTWHDVTSRHDEVSRLADRVRHDDLTGLLSRAEALDRLGAELGLARLEGRAIAVAFCDVDDFKQINDTFGHAVGDEVLRMLATRVDELVRRGDVVARFGGDELLVIMRDVDDLDTAVGLAERLRDGVRQSLRLPEGDVSVSMSIGVTAVGPEESVDVVIARADEAMYGAKSAGKDRVNALQPSGASAVS